MSEETKKLEDQVERLILFAAQAGIAFRDDDGDLITEGFLALPDELQSAINRKEVDIDQSED